MLTWHASFRSWCAACVQGRGRAERHQGEGRKELEDGSKVPVVSWDYCFLGARNRISEVEVEQSGDSPVLVMHDGVTKSFFAHLIPAEGVDFPICEKAAAESSVNVVKGHVRSIKLAVESASGVEVPADHDLLLVPYAASMHRRFAVGRDGKTAYERNEGRRAVLPLAQFSERIWWMLLQPSNRRPCPLHSRFEQGRYLGPMGGSNTVFIGTTSGVVKARTIKWLPPGERWTGSLLDEALGIELTPGALEDDGGRVGNRAPVFQPHVAVPLPELRQVRRAPLRRTDFEQFGQLPWMCQRKSRS